jgi:hypothetical protein
VYDSKNYDIHSFDIGRGHTCTGIEIDVYLKSLNKPEVEPEVKFKLVKIFNRVGDPNLHFVIDGKNYFYEIAGINADYKIVLRCTKKNLSLSCDNLSSILPSDYLKQIIQNSPTISQYPKFFDKSDPRVYDLNNYDLNSFDIGDGHKCSETEIKIFSKSNSKPENEINEVKFKLVQIVNRTLRSPLGHPNFHFKINGKMYIYGIHGIRKDYKIILRCTKRFSGKACNNNSYIAPSDLLKQIMQDKSSKHNYQKTLDISDPRVYDSKNYDIHSFDIGRGHTCTGIEIDVYLKSLNKPEVEPEVKCKLVKIFNRVGDPNLHFVIDGKNYIYEIAGINADYKIVLRCTKKNLSLSCDNLSSILPSDNLKQIIENSPSISKYPKILDKSDPRVYDLKNYDLNSFDIGDGHKCLGTEIEINEIKFKLVQIVNRTLRSPLGHPNFHFEIDGRMYIYGIHGIRKDYKIILRCTKRLSGKACNNNSYIAPLDLLKEIMQDNSSKQNYQKMLDISDPRVYDLKNYDINSFDIGKGHKCPGMAIDGYSRVWLKGQPLRTRSEQKILPATVQKANLEGEISTKAV